MNDLPPPLPPPEARVAEEPDSAAESAAVQHRILQASGVRYSLKLETAFWQVLERVARRRGMALRELVSKLAEGLPEHMNLAAGLRWWCVQHMRESLDRTEARANQLAFSRGEASVPLIVSACPAPAVQVAYSGEIVAVNAAFVRWCGSAETELMGRRIDHIFQVKTQRPMEDVLRRFRDRLPEVVPAKITFVRPGRVVVARAMLCVATHTSDEQFSYLLMIELVPA
jgi:predicted DNA-binding ribbon-helix-helix protein